MIDFIDNIPKDNQPDKSEHTDFPIVFRAAKSEDILKREDFLPTFIENPKRKASWRGLYAMSLFLEEKDLYRTMDANPPLKNSTKSIAIGFTTLNRGISMITNKNDGHISYFLYDTWNNNPYPDFKIHKVIIK